MKVLTVITFATAAFLAFSLAMAGDVPIAGGNASLLYPGAQQPYQCFYMRQSWMPTALEAEKNHQTASEHQGDGTYGVYENIARQILESAKVPYVAYARACPRSPQMLQYDHEFVPVGWDSLAAKGWEPPPPPRQQNFLAYLCARPNLFAKLSCKPDLNGPYPDMHQCVQEARSMTDNERGDPDEVGAIIRHPGRFSAGFFDAAACRKEGDSPPEM